MSPDEFILNFQGKSSDLVRKELEGILSSRVHQSSEHYEWSKVCEYFGFYDLCLRELELAVRDNPHRIDILLTLAERYIERGKYDSAERLVLRAKEIDSSHPQIQKIEEMLKNDVRLDEFSVKDLAQDVFTDAFVMRFLHLFGGREDIYARQWCDSKGKVGYSPVRAPLTHQVIKEHIYGNITVGVYPIRVDNTVKFFVVDLDINKKSLEEARVNPQFAQTLRSSLRDTTRLILEDFRSLGLEPVVEDSGYKGRHFWFFLQKPVQVDVIFNLGKLLISFISVRVPSFMHTEFFPKQPSRDTPEGLGNLIKLPLGIHRKTMRRSVFLRDEKPVEDISELLMNVPYVEDIYGVIDTLRNRVGVEERSRGERKEQIVQEQKYQEKIQDDKSEKDLNVPTPPPDWSESDFETHPEIGHIVKHCEVIGEIVKRAISHRVLSYDEQLVLIHVLGHIPSGVLAVNYLFSKTGNVPAERYLKSPLSGNPISCPKIRRRVPHITSKVNCSCPLDLVDYKYPNPLCHLSNLRKKANESEQGFDIQSVAKRYVELLNKRDDIQKEIKRISGILVDYLCGVPERSLKLSQGQLKIVENEGVLELIWEENKTTGSG